jgi:hypothetical protein
VVRHHGELSAGWKPKTAAVFDLVRQVQFSLLVRSEEESLPSCGKFLEGHKPEVNFVGAGDVFSQPTLVSVFENGVFVVAALNGADN